jgi:hypothetical protein
MTREQISQDKNFDALTEAMLDRDQTRTTDLALDIPRTTALANAYLQLGADRHATWPRWR